MSNSSLCDDWDFSPRKERVAGGTIFRLSKLGAVACYGAIQIALLVSWIHPGAYGTRASLAAAALSLLDAFALAALSCLEHSYSARPSTLINLYLLISLLFDAIQARTLWLKHTNQDVVLPAEFTTSLAIKIGLLLLEAAEKHTFLSPEWRKKSPEDISGIINRGLLIWLLRILSKGWKTLLSPTDLDPLRNRLETARLARGFSTAFSHSRGRFVTNGNPRHRPAKISLVLLRTLKWSVIAPVVPRLVQSGFTICQPLLLREFMRYLDGEKTFVGSTGYAFIILYGLVYLGLAASGCIYWRLTYQCLVKIRGCLLAAVYEKTTEIDTAQYDMNTPMSLVSTDMDRIMAGCKDIHEVWANTLEVGITVWLLYRELGIACVAPAVVATISSLGSMVMSSYAEKAQVSWMEASQERIGATSRAISGMRNVKLLGLSGGLYRLLQNLRGAELHAARHFRYIEVLTATIAFLPLLISPVFTFMVFVLQSRGATVGLDYTKAFTSLSLLQLMTQPLVWLFQAVPLLMASLGCLNRFEKYLHAQNKVIRQKIETCAEYAVDNQVGDDPKNRVLESVVPRHALTVRNGSFGWAEGNPVLKGIDVDIPMAQLTMVIGPVASGKSTFAKALIGEIPYFEGEVCVNTSSTKIAFCDQDSFIMNRTILENIVGFSNLDQAWLDKVIRAVALDRDIATLPQGIKSQVGSHGSRLSGGQRQRVSIARAIYAREQIAVFDDVLSGLDAATKEHVFKHCLGPDGLLRQIGCSVVLCTHDVALLPWADHILVFGKDGRVSGAGTFEDLSKSSAYVRSFIIEERSERPNAGELSNGPNNKECVGDDGPATELPDDLTRRLGDASIYKYLASHIGLWRLLVFLIFTCGWAVFSTFGTVWIDYWTSANSSPSGYKGDGYYLGIYALFQTLALIFLALFSGFTLTSLAVKVGTSLHQVLLRTMVRAPLSFFSTVDVGITTNRFSQDIILVDGDMPMSLLETLSASLVALVQMIFIAVAAPYVAIAYPFLLAALYFTQNFYLKTSRQLRFLDLEAKSPLYTQLLETINGLATIRSFGWAGALVKANHDLVDASQKPVYLLYMVQRWLQMVLELMIAITAILLVAVALALQTTSGGFLGVALIQLMSLSQELKMIVINYTNLETSLTAISRIKSFEESTPSEDRRETYDEVPKSWPPMGRIHFDSVSASYSQPGSEKTTLAFQDVSIQISGGQKVAICGRSGSGKSTLLAALTGLIEPTSGTILIDGLDISSIRPSELRKHLNTVPQEPFFLYKTLAMNLDPSGESSPEAMRSALESIEMWDMVESGGGLDAEISLDNYSQGQKQLIALARAILKPSRIFLMDEATSSVDHHTADMMQRIIRDRFHDRTVVAVVHKLREIADFDLVLVMDAGQVVEIGRPSELLESDSRFRKLWDGKEVLNTP
ncbi:hypothetical protein VPNG_03161 [Cytospora leucostoma]|uniref:Uncharacterized protein n=1 Tax=Cytospora leucostoma TaxID=1230097 RepID=A0A423XF39_9PEZI|nr:hypothetical protein VPNG_03161 [Cytospora leucostoma]